MDKEAKITVGKVTSQIIDRIENLSDSQKGAELATFRNSIGKSITEADDVWPILFRYLPKDFLSETGRETFEENAVFITLQLFAMCMQGSSSVVKSDSSYKGSIGMSLGIGRDNDDSEALDRRFNALITASTFSELTYHLRQLIKVVKSKEDMTINFARLADDLFYFQLGIGKKICFRWAQEYYSKTNETQSVSSEADVKTIEQ